MYRVVGRFPPLHLGSDADGAVLRAMSLDFELLVLMVAAVVCIIDFVLTVTLSWLCWGLPLLRWLRPLLLPRILRVGGAGGLPLPLRLRLQVGVALRQVLDWWVPAALATACWLSSGRGSSCARSSLTSSWWYWGLSRFRRLCPGEPCGRR